MSHPLVRRLGSDDPAERRAAALTAPEDPSAVLLVDALVGRLGDPDAAVANAVIEALARLSQHDGAVRTALGSALRGEDATARIRAALAWARVEPPPLRLLPALVEGLARPEGELRWAATRVLVDMARLQSEVHRFVTGLVRDDDRPRVRRMALAALRELSPESPETVEALLAASHADDPVLRRAALTACAALPDPPETVRARLAAALQSDDPIDRRVAERARAIA